MDKLIVGGWEPIPATKLHDELHSRCLAPDNGQVKLAIVLCDKVGIPQEVFDSARAQVRATANLPVKRLRQDRK